MPDTTLPLVAADHAIVSANGLLGDPPRTTNAEVIRIIDQALAAQPANGLVIHFHGGLVSTDYALTKLVGRLGGVYKTADAYPLFFVWGSGFMEAIRNNAADILKDPAFRELVKKVSEWVIKKISLDGTVKFRGNGGSEIADIDEFRREFDQFFDGTRDTPPSETASIDHPDGIKSRSAALDEDKLAKEMTHNLVYDRAFQDALSEAYRTPDVTQMDDHALDELFARSPDDGTTGGDVNNRGAIAWLTVMRYVASIVMAVIKRYRSGSDHGPYCTVVEEVLRSAYGNLFGATVWNAMKKDTLDGCGEDALCCASAVIAHLAQRAREGKVFSKITLVGHSTGAIYISHFLDAMTERNLTARVKVAFLAPAITFERFAQTLAKFESSALQDFRMFAMTDELESSDRLVQPLYTRSLLYFVSGLLEGRTRDNAWSSVTDMPLLGMQRFHESARFADTPEVQAAKRFLASQPGRVVWSRQDSAGAGLNSTATSHGGFDDDAATCTSLVDFIRQ